MLQQLESRSSPPVDEPHPDAAGNPGTADGQSVCFCLRPLLTRRVNMNKNPSDVFISLGFELPSIDAPKGA